MDKPITLRKSVASKRIHAKKRNFPVFILSSVGFFIGRIALFQFMNPIALAFLTSFLGNGSKILTIFVFTGIGIITRFEGLYTLKYLAAITLIYSFDIILSAFSIELNRKSKAILSGTITLICSLVFAYFYKSTYFVFLAVLEAVLVFSLAFVLKSGIDVFEKLSIKELSSETLISLSLMVGAVICGVSDIYIGSISFKFLFSSIVILVVAYSGGAVYGATCGVVLGFILTLMGFSNYSLLGILSIAGLICGIMKDTKKIGAMAGYLAGGLITALYLDSGILNMGLLYSVSIALIIFFFIPEKYIPNIAIHAKLSLTNETHLEKIKELTTEKLNGFSAALRNLSLTFTTISEKKTMFEQKDVSKIIDDVASKICAHCPHCKKCWQEDFYSSYQLSFALLEICEKKGLIRLSDLKDEYYKTCEYLETFADEINRTFEIYKNNLFWHNKMVESRDLVSQQLLGISGVLENLSKELDLKTSFNKNLEEKILAELKKEKIDISSLSVLETEDKKYEVIINKSNCHNNKVCNKDITPILNNILDTTMKKNTTNCVLNKENCRIVFSEEAKFRITSGISRAIKEGYASSGDSYSILDIKGEKKILVLSDGMGSGKKAATESRAAIDILREFIETGFDKETAIKIINSVFVLKSLEDSFSTFDICSIDLYTGIAEFVKIGAASSFIVRDENIISIKSNSLPIGILNTVDSETTTKKLKHGDIVVMVTDGLTELSTKNDKDLWIIEEIKKLKEPTPQELSDCLLKKAQEMSCENLKDDMTILAVKILEVI